MAGIRVFLFFLFLFTNGLFAKELSEYWKETGLQSQEFIRQIPSCNDDERSFLGCVKALNAVLAYSQQHLALILTSQVDELMKENPNIIEVKKDFGSTKLVEFKKLDKENSEEKGEEKKEEATKKTREEIKTENQKNINTWFEIFNAGDDRFNLEELFKEAFEKVEKDKQAEATASAINELFAIKFDPHTHLIPKAKFKDDMEFSGERFAGVGMVLGIRNGLTTIIAPLENSVALKAGLKAKDIIVEIDDQDVTKLNLEQVVDKIRGKIDTVVKIRVKRKDILLDPISIVRAPVIRENLETKVIEDSGLSIGYIKLNSFVEENTCSSIYWAVKNLELKEKVKGLILDLRGNLGGLLDQSVCAAGVFLGGNKLVVFEKRLNQASIDLPLLTYGGDYSALPLITLINDSSASASEILSGALQDHARGFIIGERSFGKGTVQVIEHYADKISIARTRSRFYLPSGRTTHIDGVTPDIEVFESPIPTEEDKRSYREEDMFFVLPSEENIKWTQKRPQEVASLNQCVQTTGSAVKFFNERQDDAIPPDYQLLFAQDAMTCMVSNEEKIAKKDPKKDGNKKPAPEKKPQGKPKEKKAKDQFLF